MRFDWDDAKSEKLKRERGFTLEEATAAFARAHVVVPKSDGPDQFAAVGFVRGKLLTVIHEYREDEEGGIIWLVTYWKATRAEEGIYEKYQR
jgi:uncharacterized DUF497 family protein